MPDRPKIGHNEPCRGEFIRLEQVYCSKGYKVIRKLEMSNNIAVFLANLLSSVVGSALPYLTKSNDSEPNTASN